MTNHPVLPTQEQFAEWDTLYFDGERQNFDYMMLKAFQAGADRRLEQVIEWLGEYETIGLEEHDLVVRLIHDLKKAMRPQENK